MTSDFNGMMLLWLFPVRIVALLDIVHSRVSAHAHVCLCVHVHACKEARMLCSQSAHLIKSSPAKYIK